ncbi:MAG: alpha/beta hydrolase [Chthonomonas sp.]|nr:alpha/beta hydrolase [Chthonomonas sp.]
MLATLLSLTLLAQAPETITYSKIDGVDLQMDVYRPAATAAKTPAFAVVVIHGGAWMGGNRVDMRDLCTALTKQGFVAASVSYRLAPKFKYPTMIQDVQTAVRYLRANSKALNIRRDKIGAAGASAGGQLSLMLGSTESRMRTSREATNQSSKVQVVLNLFGPVDMTIAQDYGRALDPVFSAVLGKPRAEAAALIKAASPYYSFTRESAPTFTIHGDKDPLVPVNQAKVLEAKLTELNVPHETRIVPGMAHGIDMKVPGTGKALQDGIDYLRKWLR